MKPTTSAVLANTKGKNSEEYLSYWIMQEFSRYLSIRLSITIPATIKRLPFLEGLESAEKGTMALCVTYRKTEDAQKIVEDLSDLIRDVTKSKLAIPDGNLGLLCHGGASTSWWPVAHFARLAEVLLRIR